MNYQTALFIILFAEMCIRDRCIVNDQIGNSVAVRMAMLYILSQIGGGLHEAFD